MKSKPEKTKSTPAEEKSEAKNFQAELEAFKAQLQSYYDSRIEALVEENARLQREFSESRKETQERSERGEAPDVEVELIYDPFDVQNGLAFKLQPVLDRHGEPTGHYTEVIIEPDDQYPEGQVLGWKSERWRADHGWRGWIPFRFGDEYTGETGEKLEKYLVDPPRKGSGEAEGDFDMFVRRKGLILCRIDKRIYDSRTKKRELKDRQQRGMNQGNTRQVLGDGVELVGEGLQDQKRPPGGWKLGEKPMLSPGAFRTELMPHNREKE